ncbi:MAG TPA: PAS domain S-box protein [Smithellaceae bacterium]|nr:PAS domain S-box protein [Smithellaceae bacterium]
MKSKSPYIILIVLAGFCAYLFFAAYNSVKKEMIRDLNSQQLSHARLAAKGIENTFNHYHVMLSYMARNKAIVNFNVHGEDLMRIFYESHTGGIKGITRMDARGRIVYTFPYNRKLIGADISAQEHVRETLKTHQPVVSDVFDAVQGFRSIAFHVPVFQGKKYSGSLAVLISFDEIARAFLKNIRIGADGYAWLISAKGVELYCPVPGHIGKNVEETSGHSPSVMSMAEKMKRGEHGETTYQYDKIRGETVKTVKKQAVYLPIKVANTFWSIVVATPEEEALSAMQGFTFNLILIIILLSFAGVFGAYYLLRAHTIVREQEKRKIIEDELKDREEFLRLVTENVQDAIRVVDLKTLKYIYANSYALNLFGLPDQNFIGSPLGFNLETEERARLYQVMSDEIEHDAERDINRSRVIELREKSKLTGEIITTENKASFIRDKNQHPVAILVISRDVTKRRLAEQELRETGERYRTIIENIVEGYYEVDLKGNMIFANPAMARMLEYSFAELIGMNNRQYMNEENARKVFAVFHQVYLSGAPEKFLNWELIKKHGENIFVETSVSLILDNGGTPVGFRGIVHDITERKKIEEALRDSEEKFRLFLEHSPIYVVFKDEKLRMVQLSKNYEKLLGMPVNEMIGKSMSDMFPSDFALKVDKEERAILRSGRSVEIEEEVGGRIYTAIKFPIIREGKSSFLAGFIIDITERKRLEERLNRAEKMEALGTLAGGVAHDLNNVLGVLVGYSELLLEKIPAGDQLHKYVDNILQSGLRGAAIVQDLLTLARRGVAVSEVVNLNSIISGYSGMPEFAALKSYHPHVKFNFNLDADLLNIKGSSVHLNKSVMNLLSNAAEAIAGVGEVKVQTENRYVDRPLAGYEDMPRGDYVVLTVSDNGNGISDKDIRNIFEPFYTKKVMGRSGTGLGLAVVWGTVKDHRGYIEVQSEEGKGTSFTIYFPASREEAASGDSGPALDEYLGRGESILVVDDVREQRELALSMLGRLGYDVTAVAGGEEAVAYIKKKKADLLVLDMIMEPGIDGLETYERISKINPGQKAVIVSGFSETERVEKAQKLGAGAYVRKPYILKKIGLAVRKELDKKK